MCKSVPIHTTKWNIPQSFQIHNSIQTPCWKVCHVYHVMSCQMTYDTHCRCCPLQLCLTQHPEFWRDSCWFSNPFVGGQHMNVTSRFKSVFTSCQTNWESLQRCWENKLWECCSHNAKATTRVTGFPDWSRKAKRRHIHNIASFIDQSHDFIRVCPYLVTHNKLQAVNRAILYE